MATHRVAMLEEFRKGCIRVLVSDFVSRLDYDPLEAYEKAEALLPAVPEMGELEVEEVLRSDYFFA